MAWTCSQGCKCELNQFLFWIYFDARANPKHHFGRGIWKFENLTLFFLLICPKVSHKIQFFKVFHQFCEETFFSFPSGSNALLYLNSHREIFSTSLFHWNVPFSGAALHCCKHISDYKLTIVDLLPISSWRLKSNSWVYSTSIDEID